MIPCSASRVPLSYLAVLTAMVLSPAVVQAQLRGVMPRDALVHETASDVQIAPDGRQLVYVRQNVDSLRDKRLRTLWTVNADGSAHRQLLPGSNETAPRWSPDGTQLVFRSDREGGAQLWTMQVASGALKRLTSVARGPLGAAWSPDGKQIAFTSLVPEPALSIAQQIAPPAGATWAPPARAFDKLIYRFDGAGELERGWSQLFVVDVASGTTRQLTKGAYHVGGGNGRGSGVPSWSPDGKTILISANRRPDYEIESTDTEVMAVDVVSGDVRALTTRFGPDNRPMMSPDGQWIAFTGYDDRRLGYQNHELYVMRADGSARRSLTASYDRSVGSPVWAPDSRGLYVELNNEGETQVGYVPLAGGVPRTIARHLGNGQTAYEGSGYSVSRAGRVAFVTSRGNHPGGVATAAIGDSSPKVLAGMNAVLLANARMGEVEMFWTPSSHDGWRVQSWLIKPPGFDASKKYPILLEIHGGPFLGYGDRFDLEKQALAGAGYLVLYVNPRGSTSYGEKFANGIHHDYPNFDRLDLESAVDAVIAKGIVDTTRLYVAGGSGGGVLTAWITSYTHRYRAAVVEYPVINWTSWLWTADTPRGTTTWFPGAPWDHEAQYAKRSPLSRVQFVKTPTMVLTGELDYRTPMSESEQWYSALRFRGVEAVLVKVPGEPHGIRESPSHWLQKMAYVQGWLDGHGGRQP
ncbi:MAG TPA: S9 family peptidase [Gemmatimonas aurantiaca]|uniref:Acyl-peptide hydrolase n=2 Tax=Gemmatimonas aurantiaca TaxID=173480 RepID=C1A4Y7_GEMAT|nr:S9 family peptidase [Gemmatimonas aurantiaca]BAH37297.1 putative S9C family peptidase [Gemmatimonas aurantiaca T-27]HCT55712.1 S9 family peptidase [Gemmatimonas aurantiaca]